jgi:hypothetical protein
LCNAERPFATYCVSELLDFFVTVRVGMVAIRSIEWVNIRRKYEQVNRTVSILRLGDNHLGGAGCKLVCEALEDNLIVQVMSQIKIESNQII